MDDTHYSDVLLEKRCEDEGEKKRGHSEGIFSFVRQSLSGH